MPLLDHKQTMWLVISSFIVAVILTNLFMGPIKAYANRCSAGEWLPFIVYLGVPMVTSVVLFCAGSTALFKLAEIIVAIVAIPLAIFSVIAVMGVFLHCFVLTAGTLIAGDSTFGMSAREFTRTALFFLAASSLSLFALTNAFSQDSQGKLVLRAPDLSRLEVWNVRKRALILVLAVPAISFVLSFLMVILAAVLVIPVIVGEAAGLCAVVYVIRWVPVWETM